MSFNKKKLKEELTKLQKRNDEIIGNCELEVRTLDTVEDTEFNSNLARMQEIRSQLDGNENLNGSTKIVQNGGNIMENLELRERFYKGLGEGKVVIEERGIANETGGEGNQSFEQTVPQHLMNEVIKKVRENGNIINDVQVISVPGGVTIFEKAKEHGYATMLTENGKIPEADATQLNPIHLGTKRCGDCIVVSEQLLLNSPIISEQTIIEEIADKFHNTLTQQIIVGDGTGVNLKGIMLLKDDEVVKVEATDNIIEDMLEASTDVKAIYLKGSKYYLNRALFKEIAKMKNANGDYYVIKDVVNDEPQYKIFGHVIEIIDEMVDGAFIFGNLKQSVVLNMKKDMTIKVLNEKYADIDCKGILYNAYFDMAVKNKYALRIRTKAVA